MEPPEIFHQTATPADILQRFDLFRERYRTGEIDTQSYNQVLKTFQFQDVTGVWWSPGAQTSEWYRRDGSRWVRAFPPERLRVPQTPLEDPAPQASANCPNCGAPTRGKKFCTTCGSALG